MVQSQPLPRLVKDLRGRRFGRLVVQEYVDRPQHAGAFWDCACDCGGRVVVAAGRLVSGNTQSCGCLRDDTRRRGWLTNSPGTQVPDGCPPSALITATDAGRELRLSIGQVHQWHARGRIKSVGTTTDGRPLFRVADLMRRLTESSGRP